MRQAAPNPRTPPPPLFPRRKSFADRPAMVRELSLGATFGCQTTAPEACEDLPRRGGEGRVVASDSLAEIESGEDYDVWMGPMSSSGCVPGSRSRGVSNDQSIRAERLSPPSPNPSVRRSISA